MVSNALRRPPIRHTCQAPNPLKPWCACSKVAGHAHGKHPTDHYAAGLWWPVDNSATVAPSGADTAGPDSTSPLF